MTLMSRFTGKDITDEDHLRQSIEDIVTTPKGSRVMRRDYGSSLFLLVDQPANPGLYSRIRSAIAESIDAWEPRVVLSKIILDATNISRGQLGVGFEGYYLPGGRVVRLRDITIAFRVAA